MNKGSLMNVSITFKTVFFIVMQLFGAVKCSSSELEAFEVGKQCLVNPTLDEGCDHSFETGSIESTNRSLFEELAVADKSFSSMSCIGPYDIDGKKQLNLSLDDEYRTINTDSKNDCSDDGFRLIKWLGACKRGILNFVTFLTEEPDREWNGEYDPSVAGDNVICVNIDDSSEEGTGLRKCVKEGEASFFSFLFKIESENKDYVKNLRIVERTARIGKSYY